MNITLLGASFTDDEAVTAVQYQLGRLTSAIPENIIRKMISHWRAYKRDGMSDNWILAEMKKQRVAIGGMVATQGGAFPVLSDGQISNFVTAMQRLSKGDMPGNPWERPSWGEAFDMGLGKLDIPWGTIALVAGGAALLYGFVSGAGKGLFSR